MKKLRNSRTRGQWAKTIAEHWRGGVESIIATGAALVKAKAELDHGEFLKMIKADLPFKRTTAHMLMAIATDDRLANVQRIEHLPLSWGTLYDLTKLTDEKLEEAFASRAIHPEMERSEVVALKLAGVREEYESRKEQGGRADDLQSLIDTGKRFSVIYADPPWEFNVYSGKGKQRSAERHYDTAGLEAISSLPVEKLAEEDCALFLWAVMPELPGALEIISAWGFEYKTVGFTWVKQNPNGEGLFTGMGYWTRANAEVCLLATRGSPMRLAMDVPQVILSPVREHSQKPDEIPGRIERLLAGPYLEMFARKERPDWTTWGNEIPRTEYPEAAE
jgi:N6-adenosine-specific RNA methylase IME4